MQVDEIRRFADLFFDNWEDKQAEAASSCSDRSRGDQ